MKKALGGALSILMVPAVATVVGRVPVAGFPLPVR